MWDDCGFHLLGTTTFHALIRLSGDCLGEVAFRGGFWAMGVTRSQNERWYGCTWSHYTTYNTELGILATSSSGMEHKDKYLLFFSWILSWIGYHWLPVGCFQLPSNDLAARFSLLPFMPWTTCCDRWNTSDLCSRWSRLSEAETMGGNQLSIIPNSWVENPKPKKLSARLRDQGPKAVQNFTILHFAFWKKLHKTV